MIIRNLMLAVTLSAPLIAVAQPTDDLSIAALAYASKYADKISNEAPVEDSGVYIPSGSGYGQSMQPATDQLAALGYLPPTRSSSGLVKLTFKPSGCNLKKAGACVLDISVKAPRVATNQSIQLR